MLGCRLSIGQSAHTLAPRDHQRPIAQHVHRGNFKTCDFVQNTWRGVRKTKTKLIPNLNRTCGDVNFGKELNLLKMESRLKNEMIVELELEKKEKHDGNLIGVLENGSYSHGNFILGVVTSHKLKCNEGICFLALLNPQSHYQYVGSKLGFNLKGSIERQQVKFLDTLRTTQESIVENTVPKLGDDLILWLSNLIEVNLKDLHSRFNRVTIIIDDLSVLLGLGCPLKKILCFLQFILSLISTKSKAINKDQEKWTSLVILTHIDEQHDEESVRLAAFLKHVSLFCANVSPLRITVTSKTV